jgi:hypothetical protein
MEEIDSSNSRDTIFSRNEASDREISTDDAACKNICESNGTNKNSVDGMDDGDDSDSLIFSDDEEAHADDRDLDEVHEASCRRAYVAAYGPGVPAFLAGARPRAGKGWAWLLAAAASGQPLHNRAFVGRTDYGPLRFYVGDVDRHGLPHGYGAMVHLRADSALKVDHNVSSQLDGTTPRRQWPAPRAITKWHEGFWRSGRREGDGIGVCLGSKVSMQGTWRDDLFDGYGVRTYGRGRWTLLADASGSGRWSDGDLWCYRGYWRDGERHGSGTLILADRDEPYTGMWVRGIAVGSLPEPTL